VHSSCSDADDDDDDDGKSGTSAENSDFYECMKHFYRHCNEIMCLLGWHKHMLIPLIIVIERSPYGT
jgi:hypothetical protein